MKKLLFKTIATLTLLTFGSTSYSQVSKGNVLIEPTYGYSLGRNFISIFEIPGASSSKVSSFGPIGLRAMYYTTDKFSLGADVVYRTSVLKQTYDVNGTEYKSENGVTQLRVMCRGEFHLVESDVIDYFLSFGVGYKDKSYTFWSNEPGYLPTSSTGMPIAMRLSTGVRGYLTENITVSGEIGLGGGSFANLGFGYIL